MFIGLTRIKLVETCMSRCQTTPEPFAIPATCIDAFRTEIHRVHNVNRTAHRAVSLSVNSSLNTLAQGYANQMATTAVFAHNSNRGANIGENLYTSWSSSASFFNFTTARCRCIKIVFTSSLFGYSKFLF